MAEIDFLGTGWSFPPTLSKNKKSVLMTSGIDDINSSLHILLSTTPGERIMQPAYGCNLKRLLFEPLDTSLKAYIKDLIKVAILYHEPRIRLNDITLVDKPENGLIEITLIYTVRSTNSRYNFVYPFYKDEGIDINP